MNGRILFNGVEVEFRVTGTKRPGVLSALGLSGPLAGMLMDLRCVEAGTHTSDRRVLVEEDVHYGERIVLEDE